MPCSVYPAWSGTTLGPSYADPRVARARFVRRGLKILKKRENGRLTHEELVDELADLAAAVGAHPTLLENALESLAERSNDYEGVSDLSNAIVEVYYSRQSQVAYLEATA